MSGGARAQLTALAERGIAWPALPGADATLARDAAVLVLFGVLDDRPASHVSTAVPTDLDVLLLARAAALAHHPGQVAFPGGRVEPDDDGAVGAALREAAEETGLDPSGVEVLGTLAALPLQVSRHVVSPVLAWWTRPSPVFAVDDRESATVFRTPVADLLDPANRRTALVPGRPYAGPAFLVGNDAGHHLVWGFTALILDRLFDELEWAEPWDARRTVPAPV